MIKFQPLRPSVLLLPYVLFPDSNWAQTGNLLLIIIWMQSQCYHLLIVVIARHTSVYIIPNNDSIAICFLTKRHSTLLYETSGVQGLVLGGSWFFLVMECKYTIWVVIKVDIMLGWEYVEVAEQMDTTRLNGCTNTLCMHRKEFHTICFSS